MQAPYSHPANNIVRIGSKEIHIFDDLGENIDMTTVESFGEEWTAFASFSDSEIKIAGDQYFDIISQEDLENAYCLDVGCGTGRWTKYLSPKVKAIEALDPSKAVYSAAHLLSSCDNVRITQAGVDTIPFADNTFDLVFSLGVLHHIPDTASAMSRCVAKLKPGGRFLVYLYYNFEQRGFLFKAVFWASAGIRWIVSKFPSGLKKVACQVLAILLYFPLIYLSRGMDMIGFKTLSNLLPLSYYKSHSANIIFNDALDRFGTPLEQRFSRAEITEMMKKAGLSDVVFSENEPYWHAIGIKK